MPVDNLGQTFRFIVEQAGGGGGGGGTDGGGGGGGGGSGGRGAREANEFRNMMSKMVKAVDSTEKTTANAFQQGFKKLGLQLTFANMLKQSQVFTGTLNAIFQVVGALVDITLSPFLPLIVKFLEKAIPKLISTAESMAKWVGGELAQLDNLGIVGYIKKKLETDIPAALESFGPVVAAAMGTATNFIIDNIPYVISMGFTTLGPIVGSVLATTIETFGDLLTKAVKASIKFVTDTINLALRAIADVEILGTKPFGFLDDLADGLDSASAAAGVALDGASSAFAGLGSGVGEATEEMFRQMANFAESPPMLSLFDALGDAAGGVVESGVMGLQGGLIALLEGIAEYLPEKKPSETGSGTGKPSAFGGSGYMGGAGAGATSKGSFMWTEAMLNPDLDPMRQEFSKEQYPAALRHRMAQGESAFDPSSTHFGAMVAEGLVPWNFGEEDMGSQKLWPDKGPWGSIQPPKIHTPYDPSTGGIGQWSQGDTSGLFPSNWTKMGNFFKEFMMKGAQTVTGTDPELIQWAMDITVNGDKIPTAPEVASMGLQNDKKQKVKLDIPEYANYEQGYFGEI